VHSYNPLVQIQSDKGQLRRRARDGPAPCGPAEPHGRISTEPDTLEVAPGTIHESVQGWVPSWRQKKNCALLWKKLSTIEAM